MGLKDIVVYVDSTEAAKARMGFAVALAEEHGAHLIGIAFAGALLAGWGPEWAREPTLIPALIVGIGSVAAPFLLIQPGMGLGIAARRARDPAAARLRSLTTHTIYALGLYAAGWAVRLVAF